MVALLVSYISVRAFGVDVITSLKVVIVANGTSMLAYYLHERIWDKIEKGRVKGV